jgi:predicted P-loop ATPase
LTTVSVGPSLVLPTDDTSVPLAAEMLAAAGLAPVPLYGIGPDGLCQCGPKCEPRTRGKHPVGHGWQQKATLDLDVVRDRFRKHNGNIGVYLALGGLVLIDCDGAGGIELAQQWSPPPTLTQRSGSGVGRHYIYRLQPHQRASGITDRRVAGDDAGHIDIKIRGQFVCAPSMHASGQRYRFTNCEPIRFLSDDIYELIRKPTSSTDRTVSRETISDRSDPYVLLKRAEAYIAGLKESIQGSDGSGALWDCARQLARWHLTGLSEARCIELLDSYNATKCHPPWSRKELDHKWRDAKNAKNLTPVEERPNPRALVSLPGGRSAASVAREKVPLPSTLDWRDELMFRSNARGDEYLLPTTDNVMRILQLDPRWAGRLSYNLFSQNIECDGELPWDRYTKPTERLGLWSDHDATRLQAWLIREWREYRFEPGVESCERAVDVVSRGHAYHPVRQYLDSLVWDWQPRFAHFASTYLGAADNVYHQTATAWWLLSAVARIYDPGCKVDTVTILEGGQGRKKSTAIEALAGKWFSDAELDITNKDAAMLIQGYWMVELGEVDSLMRSEPSEAKRFFSRRVDRFRPPYGRRLIEVPRQSVFVGTTNLHEYLFDSTGARRYVPIQCGLMNIEQLRADRDQIWAEVVHEYRDGRVWYSEHHADLELMASEQADRTTDDAWEALVISWLSGHSLPYVTTDQVFDVLHVEPRDRDRRGQMRIGAILSKFEWKRQRVRQSSGLRVYAYFRPNG